VARFLSELDRRAWLATSRTNPVLLEFVRLVDSLCETALETTGRELPAEHAVVILLRDAAEDDTATAAAQERLAA
jgi:hypothetical protein